MKRIGALCIAIALCFLTAVPCSAAVLTEKGASENIDVYAKYIRSSDVYTAPAENGEASVTLEDGICVTASNVPDGELYMVVYPISENDAEAWSWFEGCIMPYGVNICSLEIYFVDGDGNRVDISGAVTVTVEQAGDYANLVVCYLDTDGTVTELVCSVDGSCVTFEFSRNGYYVLAEGIREPEPPDDDEDDDDTGVPTPPVKDPNGETEVPAPPEEEPDDETGIPTPPEEEPDDETEIPTPPDDANNNTNVPDSGEAPQTNNPKTGDEARLGLWWSVLCISIAVLLAALLYLGSRWLNRRKGN